MTSGEFVIIRRLASRGGSSFQHRPATEQRPEEIRAITGITCMSARFRDTMACINIQGSLAIVPWTPMMAGTQTR
jgi:hypothetical protein